jgi:microcystin-dependent protein
LSTLKIPTAKVFEPLLAPARYKAAFGGRGSGKSHFFGELLIEICQAERGTSAVCIREAQRTLAQSSKRLIESKIASLGLNHRFKIFNDKIETPGDGLIIFRGLQAATAKYRDDIAGAILTGGTSIAYTLASFEVFDTLAHLNGQMIAFTPHTTNGATVTLNVDSLGAKPLRTSPGVELLAGTIIQGTPYVAVYNNSDGAFYLQGFYGNPYNVPSGAGMDYWLPTAPNSSFVFPIGQAISRTTYAALFAAMGTTFGSGDGSTTFNLPDKTGRVSVMKESAPTRLTSTYFGGNSTLLGAIGGSESHTLTTGEIPAHQHPVFLKDPGHSHSFSPSQPKTLSNVGGSTGFTGGGLSPIDVTINSNTTGITIGSVNGVANDNQTANAGGGNPHAIVQPTIVCNYIIRII